MSTILVALLTVACVSQPVIQEQATNSRSLTTGFERVEEVWQLLEQQHITRSDLDSDKISEAAIRGML